MLLEPKCYTRGCKHYQGVINDGDETTERNACAAFPEGIPDSIAYGDDSHDKVLVGQAGTFVFEKA